MYSIYAAQSQMATMKDDSSAAFPVYVSCRKVHQSSNWSFHQHEPSPAASEIFLQVTTPAQVFHIGLLHSVGRRATLKVYLIE